MRDDNKSNIVHLYTARIDDVELPPVAESYQLIGDFIRITDPSDRKLVLRLARDLVNKGRATAAGTPAPSGSPSPERGSGEVI